MKQLTNISYKLCNVKCAETSNRRILNKDSVSQNLRSLHSSLSAEISEPLFGLGANVRQGTKRGIFHLQLDD
jgi:hypothetical protein